MLCLYDFLFKFAFKFKNYVMNDSYKGEKSRFGNDSDLPDDSKYPLPDLKYLNEISGGR